MGNQQGGNNEFSKSLFGGCVVNGTRRGAGCCSGEDCCEGGLRVGTPERQNHLGISSYGPGRRAVDWRSEEHTSELQSLMRISYAVFCLKKQKKDIQETNI